MDNQGADMTYDTHEIARRAQSEWMKTALPHQLPPEGDWTEWGVAVGRGAGKTTAGANWLWAATWANGGRSAVVAPTRAAVRNECFEGPSGLLAVIPPELIENYNRSSLTITLLKGATIRGFGADDMDSMRGYDVSLLWCDEVAALGPKRLLWDTLLFNLRPKQVCWTSTLEPSELTSAITAPKAGRVVTHGGVRCGLLVEA